MLIDRNGGNNKDRLIAALCENLLICWMQIHESGNCTFVYCLLYDNLSCKEPILVLYQFVLLRFRFNRFQSSHCNLLDANT